MSVSGHERKSRYDVALDCVHCGLCLPACPTYQHLGEEADSPRGRIYLMRAYEEKQQPLTTGMAEHLDRCLVCRACETACPSGVEFGGMMEDFRALLRPALAREESSLTRRLGQWLLERILPYRKRLRFAVSLLWFYQASGLARVFAATGLLRLWKLERKQNLLPRVPSPRRRKDWPVELPGIGSRRARVLFLRGCVAPEFLPEMYEASLEVLRRNGCDVVTPAAQTCCGALHFHSGYRDSGLRLMRQNLEAFLEDSPSYDAVIVNAAGCGSTLKEYGRLASSDLAAGAATLSAQVRDISEFLVQLGLRAPANKLPARVAYDEPCHLLHGQGISSEPKQLLQSIPGVELVAFRDADRCCGSAGIYNLTHTDLAEQIASDKIDSLLAAHPDYVATGNPGCILQIRSGLAQRGMRQPMVLHPVELLARAYRNASTRQ